MKVALFAAIAFMVAFAIFKLISKKLDSSIYAKDISKGKFEIQEIVESKTEIYSG